MSAEKPPSNGNQETLFIALTIVVLSGLILMFALDSCISTL